MAFVRRVAHVLSRTSLHQPIRVSCHKLIARTFATITSEHSYLDGDKIGIHLNQIDSNKLNIELSKTSRPKLPKEQLKFGQLMSDHMLSIDWDYRHGWHTPHITPYQSLQIDPAASVLHYALECFEGMKCYIDKDNNIRLFRPEENIKRMNKSAYRLLMPYINSTEFIKCIEKLVSIDKSWIPTGEGYSLYLRPTLISTHPYIGVSPSQSCKLYVITSPVGPYYPSGFAPISVYAEHKYARAWPGGTGDAKIGGNYAISIRPAYEASKLGYGQVLWLVGNDYQVTEVGTMNMFFFIKNKSTGRNELITAPLDGTVLPGITRMSILELARTWNEFDVSERVYTMNEIITAINDGRMIEAFGAGTAAVVSPVNKIAFKGTDYDIPLDKSNTTAKAGKLTQRVWDTITGIQYGNIKHEWSRIVNE